MNRLTGNWAKLFGVALFLTLAFSYLWVNVRAGAVDQLSASSLSTPNQASTLEDFLINKPATPASLVASDITTTLSTPVYTNATTYTASELDQRFVGLLAHVHWLIERASLENNDAASDGTSRDFLYRQIDRTSDNFSDSLDDARVSFAGDVSSLDTRLLTAELSLTNLNIAAASSSIMAANLTSNGHWLSGDGDDEGVFIDSNGRVGIGTTTPGARLDVAGSVNIDGDILRNGSRLLSSSATIGSILLGQGISGSITGGANTLIGYEAGRVVTSGRESTFVGYKAGYSYTGNGDPVEDGLNTFLGSFAGYSTEGAGISNVFVGQKAGVGNINGAGNTFLGTHAASCFTTGTGNVAVGWAVMDCGSSNTGISGNANTFLGTGIAKGLGNRESNVAIGYYAASNLATGLQNVIIGRTSGSSLTSGGRNNIIGFNAGYNLATHNDNTLLGWQAGLSLVSANNTVVGANSLINATFGNNTILGSSAGNTITSGYDNTIIGRSANVGSQFAAYRTVIGSGATGQVDNSVTLGRNTDVVLVPGNIGIGTTNPSLFKLQVAGNVGPNADNTYTLGAIGSDWECIYYEGGNLGTCASDRDLKTNITSLTYGEEEDSALDKLSRLQVRSFEYKTATGDAYNGLIAQEVREAGLESLVTERPNGYLAVRYGDLQWVVIEAIQDLWAKVLGHDERLTELEAENEALKARLDSVERELNIEGEDSPVTSIPPPEEGNEAALVPEVVEEEIILEDDVVNDGEEDSSVVEEEQESETEVESEVVEEIIEESNTAEEPPATEDDIVSEDGE